MGDPFRKVQRGEPLQIPAETFNACIDAAVDFRRRTQNRQIATSGGQADANTILVKNASGGDCGQFDVLGIDQPLFKPADNLWSFQSQLAIAGVKPNHDRHVGRFVVLLEPIRAGLIGRGLLSGVCPIRLNVLDEHHDWADIEPGETDSLKTDTAGSAFILWKEPAGGGTAGNGGYGGYGSYGYGYGYGYYGALRWALVRIGNLSDGEQWGTV